MSDLINRDDAIQAILDTITLSDDLDTIKWHMIDSLKEVESADPPGFIRCKDCKHFSTSFRGVECGGYCRMLEYTSREPDDFCSWAEEGENDYQRRMNNE
jgi:hypothetical protein